MSKQQHTPGPWIAKAGISKWNVTTSKPPRTFNIAAINTDRIEQEANASLIAAAPELLCALQKLCAIQKFGDVASWAAELDEASAAIAKATGG